MSDEADTIEIPTELERADGFLDLAVLAGAFLACWYAALYGVPIPVLAILMLPVAVWTLTGEPAADIPYLGAVATGLRSKLGWRRAHEWLLAYGHFFRLVIWPIWEARCAAFLKSSRQAILRWRARQSAWTPSSRLRERSWGCRIPFRLLARRAK